MSSQLAIAVTICFTLAALWLTIRAWQVRRTTPRTVSLALSTAACVAILVVAADLPLELPELLCKHPLPRRNDHAFGSDLADALQDWRWHVRPCRRLQVQAGRADLMTPVDLPHLAALAANRGIAVDVGLEAAVLDYDNPLRLEHDDKGSLPLHTPIPASQTNHVRPSTSTSDAEPPINCQLDDDEGDRLHTTPTLHDLLKADRATDYNGFHRLQCWGRGESAYVHVSSPLVKIVTKARLDDRHAVVAPEGLSLGPAEVHIVDHEPDGTSDPSMTVDDVAMLVLDRPQRPESCALARDALTAGKSVIVAMPEPAFVEACRDVLLIHAGGQPKPDAVPLVDRTPRITFVLDEFADDLRNAPSCVLPHCNNAIFNVKPQPLAASSDVQEDAMRDACKRLTRSVFAKQPACAALPASSSPELSVQRRSTTLPESLSRDQQLLERSSPATTLRELQRRFAQTSPRVYYENDLTIVFTYDPRIIENPTPYRYSIDSFLDTGVRLHIGVIRDPYGDSLGYLYPSPYQEPSTNVAPVLLADSDKRSPEHLSTCDEPARCLQLKNLPSLDQDAQTGAELHARLHSRFALSPADESSPAPARFLWWEPTIESGRPGAATVARTTEASGLRARPLAIGMMYRRGHLLLLNYSPFEWFDGSNWQNAPKTHAEVLGGYRLLSNLYATTEALLAGTGETVRVVQLKPDGAVWITMGRATSDDAALPEQLAFVEDVPTGTEPFHIVAPIVDFDDVRGEQTYALPARELTRLSRCVALYHDLHDKRDPVYACPPSEAERSSSAMDTARSLRLLARYTGGRDLERGEPIKGVLRTRSLGLATLALILLVAWGRRAARRILGAQAHRRLRHLEQLAQRRYDPPDAVVAAAGDWDGRSSTWPRTGAFGGYRPLEAGDRPSAIVLQDIVLPSQGGPRLLPRVMLRIEEASPGVLVLVNLGESMRVPGGSEHTKAVFAGHVALHVAAAAWKIRGEVEIHAVGIGGETEIVAPTRLSPGYEELAVNMRARLAQPSSRAQAPWPDDLPDCGSIVYVSDFQLEDSRELEAWVARLEGVGIRVGGVMVYSPLEFTMIEGGRLAGSGVWADRTDWDPDDVFAAFGRRRDAIEQVFDAATTGGLVVAGTHYNSDDVEVAFESGRLLQILR